VTASNEINDFFNSEHLNLNKDLLTLLHYINYSPELQPLLEPQDQTLLTAFIKFLNQ